MCEEFTDACEESFGTRANISVTLLSEPKAYTTFYDDAEQNRLDQINEENTLASSNSLEKISEDLWNQAGYVEVTLRPTDTEKAPTSAFGHLEFKGNLSKSATYYLQGGDKTEDAKETILQNHKSMLTGDGFQSHGDQSGRTYMSIASKMGTPSEVIGAVLAKGNFSLKL